MKMVAIQLPAGLGLENGLIIRTPVCRNTVLVAADHRQIVNQCRRRQESVEGRDRLSQAQTTPLVGHPFVHRQDAVSELGSRCAGATSPRPVPCSGRASESARRLAGSRRAPARSQNSSSAAVPSYPVAHAGITAVLFAQFAQDVGVEQKAAHSSTGRGEVCGPRSKSLSSPTLGIESKILLERRLLLGRPEQRLTQDAPVLLLHRHPVLAGLLFELLARPFLRLV